MGPREAAFPVKPTHDETWMDTVALSGGDDPGPRNGAGTQIETLRKDPRRGFGIRRTFDVTVVVSTAQVFIERYALVEMVEDDVGELVKQREYKAVEPIPPGGQTDSRRPVVEKQRCAIDLAGLQGWDNNMGDTHVSQPTRDRPHCDGVDQVARHRASDQLEAVSVKASYLRSSPQ